jgi:Cd2+/Zn2+-exporting ATPase
VARGGDGITAAPALAAADVGSAIGAALGGTAQAMETADIALMGDDIRQIPYALKLSHDTMKIIQQNVTFTLGIKLLFVLLVLAGWGTMWMAVFADTGAALIVTLNGMRLLQNNPLMSATKMA